MFRGFTGFDIVVSGTRIHGRTGGDGPPILSLHGVPETDLMWHRVTPALAQHHTVVVATDIRGFGDSGQPASADGHSPYSMRAIVRDQVQVMKALGYETFAVAGHET